MDILHNKADRVKVTFYTDPLCCWSWAMLPHWQQFLLNYSDRINYSYCLAGMIPDWTKYNDPLSAVSRPAQMGPIWMEAHHRTGATINDRIWAENPPASSYPACVAIKAAALQGITASEIYLQAVWSAVMCESYDISKKEVLLEVAREAGITEASGFDYHRFAADYNSEPARAAFRSDLQQIAYHKIGRFPTMTFTRNGKGLIMTGYRPYESLVEAFENVQRSTAGS